MFVWAAVRDEGSEAAGKQQGGGAAALAGVAPTRGGPLAQQRSESPLGRGFHPYSSQPASQPATCHSGVLSLMVGT